MISKTMEDALSKHIVNEWWSGYLYKAMEAWFAAEDFPGFANWFNVQTLEEMAHGEIIFRYVSSVGGRVILGSIPEPRNDFSSIREMIEFGLEHEKKVTAMINALMDQAKKENDHAAEIMLQWFVNEQVEEESNFGLLLKKVKMVEGDGRGMLMLDQELAARVFTPPAILTAGP